MTGKQFAFVVVITFIVAMIWVITDIIFNIKPSIPTSPKLEGLLQQVNPNFNTRLINTISSEVMDVSEVPYYKAAPQPSASVFVQSTPDSTESAQTQ